MTTALHLCRAEDAPILTDLMGRFAVEENLNPTADERLAAIAPLLEQQPYGMAYLLGPRRAPVGYMIVTLSWSLQIGGIEATISELYLRDAIRGRGIETEVVQALIKALKPNGIVAMSLLSSGLGAPDIPVFQKAGFAPSEAGATLTRIL